MNTECHFFWLFVILTVVTLVGHGIWVLVALVIRAIAGVESPKQKRAKTTRACPFCGGLTPTGRDRCDVCGRPVESPMAKEVADAQAVILFAAKVLPLWPACHQGGAECCQAECPWRHRRRRLADRPYDWVLA